MLGMPPECSVDRLAAAAASLSTEHSGGIPSIREKDAVLKAMG